MILVKKWNKKTGYYSRSKILIFHPTFHGDKSDLCIHILY